MPFAKPTVRIKPLTICAQSIFFYGSLPDPTVIYPFSLIWDFFLSFQVENSFSFFKSTLMFVLEMPFEFVYYICIVYIGLASFDVSSFRLKFYILLHQKDVFAVRIFPQWAKKNCCFVVFQMSTHNKLIIFYRNFCTTSFLFLQWTENWECKNTW